MVVTGSLTDTSCACGHSRPERYHRCCPGLLHSSIHLPGTRHRRSRPNVCRVRPSAFRAHPTVFRVRPRSFRTRPAVCHLRAGNFRVCSSIFRPRPSVFRVCAGIFRVCAGIFRRRPGLCRVCSGDFRARSAICRESLGNGGSLSCRTKRDGWLRSTEFPVCKRRMAAILAALFSGQIAVVQSAQNQ